MNSNEIGSKLAEIKDLLKIDDSVEARLHMQREFEAWLSDVSKNKRRSYSQSTISNYIWGIKDINDKMGVDIFLIKSNDELQSLYNTYIGNPVLRKRSQENNDNIKCGFDRYVEFFDWYLNQTSNNDLSQNNDSLEKMILSQYSKMDFSVMEKEMFELYDEFSKKFSADVLNSINDENLPKYLFLSDEFNKSNMAWHLEFKPKNKLYFGNIGGGSSYTYGLHYSKKNNSWVTGTSANPILLNYDGAVAKSVEFRNILVGAVSIIEKYSIVSSKEDYQKMYKELYANFGDEINRIWIRKYLHMMFPHLFATYYSQNWLKYLNKKCGYNSEENLFVLSGNLSLLANKLNIENAVFSKVLCALFGSPDRKVDINIADEEEVIVSTRKARENPLFDLNIILYGAPGTGKTYSTASYAVNIIENKVNDYDRVLLKEKYKEYMDNGQIVFTTFHQNYGYEDFVQGLRPITNNGVLELKPVDGIFKIIADKANDDPDNNYVIIIDEINRGNISKIFGELITLIEEDKRWGECEQLEVKLPSGDLFKVPNNLYIIGTMNSADKSISLIDTALRRRFSFMEVSPNSNLIKDETLKNVFESLNNELRKQLDSSDLLIGHSYFINKSANDLKTILNCNIIPLLYEYYYDVENKVKNTLKEALKDVDGYTIVGNQHGRIRIE